MTAMNAENKTGSNTTQPAIVLHQWQISPFCGKIRKVLAFKGLTYSVVEYAGLRALKASRLSSAGKLPVLDYAGERFQDSSLIARMLDQRHPTPALLPREPAARHLAHLLEDWADESLYWYELWARFCDPVARDRSVALLCAGRPGFERFVVKLGVGRYRRAAVAQGLGRYPKAHVLAELHAHLRALEGRLECAAWLTGAEPSIADIAVSAQLDEILRTCTFAQELQAYTRLHEWLLRCRFGAE
jgi:glutathione S-transferase